MARHTLETCTDSRHYSVVARLLCHRCRSTILLRYNRILLVLAFSAAVTTENSAVMITVARYATHTVGGAIAVAASVEAIASAVKPRSPMVFNSFNRAVHGAWSR